jgi:hypothetical protein
MPVISPGILTTARSTAPCARGTYKGSLDDARTTRRLFHPPQFNESEKRIALF